MADSQPAISSPAGRVRGRSRRIWMPWVGTTVACVALASLLAWQLTSLNPRATVPVQQEFSFVALVETALIVATGQWLVLRRYKLDAAWWIPVSVGANIVAGVFVGPLIISLSIALGAPPSIHSLSFAILSSVPPAIVVSTAQALVMRRSGAVAWAWIPASTVGAVLAASLLRPLSLPVLMGVALLYGLPIPALIIWLASLGAFLSSLCQAPVLVRLVR